MSSPLVVECAMHPENIQTYIDEPGAGPELLTITTSQHKAHEKFEKKVLTYDLGSQALETILTAIETHTSPNAYGQPPPSRFSIFEECMIAPVHKPEEETTLSSAPAKAVKEILLRLPAKSVVQYKVVCKRWLRLFESESFFRSYNSQQQSMMKRPKLMLVGKAAGEESAFSFAPFDPWLGAGEAPAATGHGALLDEMVLCSKPCHGMNLVSTATEDHLCNPVTGFHESYPNRSRHEEVAGRSVGLTFDPLSRQHALVRMVYHTRDFGSRHYFAVPEVVRCGKYGYRSRQNPVAPPPLPTVTDTPPAYVGGVLYWMSDPRLGPTRQRAVVSFDAATRRFDAVPCPPCIAAWDATSPCRAFVVELGGALCAVLADPEANSMDVWRLERGDGGWGRAFMIRLDGAPPGYDLGTNDVVPLAVDPDDGRILLSTGRRMGMYDPAEQRVEDVCSLDQSLGEVDAMEDRVVPLVPMVYEESLAGYPCQTRARRLSLR